jgi:hypothetical protein
LDAAPAIDQDPLQGSGGDRLHDEVQPAVVILSDSGACNQ